VTIELVSGHAPRQLFNVWIAENSDQPRDNHELRAIPAQPC
jgi:hypothetical protein